ncbi:MAG TPA: HAMP domain-containing histidine kinase [Erysipelothrix sp.]|nr:HAMP domain-containing histidine kinase [Erysipelothrix sp.]
MIKWIVTNIVILIFLIFIDIHPALAALGILLVNAVFYFKERYDRKKKVNKLNNYLSSLNLGQQVSHFANYSEGELSVLQSELYKLSVTLTHQNEQFKENHKFIQDSLNDIAHQIKTPLTSMMVMIDLMGETELPYEKQKEFVGSMQKQLERLKLLVTNLLTLSKLDAQVIKYNPSWISDKELFEIVLEPFQVILELKEIPLIEKYTDEEVYIDVDWMVEALGNLVKNAIEYSQKDEPLSIVSEINPLYWKITIEDSGKGMSQDDIDHLFERFYRGKNSSTDSVGIGLSLTERIIVQQQGKISVESKEGEFTRFKIEFYHKPRKEEEQ